MRRLRHFAEKVADSHRLLSAAAAVTFAAWLVTLFFNLSDTAFYPLLVGWVGFGWLAWQAAQRAVERIRDEDPDPFATRARIHPDTDTRLPGDDR